MKKLLIDAATVTDATKIEFTLKNENFFGTPAVRQVGMVAGDTATLFHKVNGIWESTDIVLTESIPFAVIESLGTYAVDIALTVAGPVSVEVEASGRL